MAEQIALFDGPDALDHADGAHGGEDFWSCHHPELSGPTRYVNCVWAPGDPERSPRDGSDMGALWRRALMAESVEQHAEIILAHLADGVPRTFNRICIELYDKNAIHMLELPPDLALWRLNDKGLVEHTNVVPILWRRKGQAA